uniref:Uncharacterized protein n=1 Tax=Rhizochromulina marina TaxID=1034831 RepID=A0A7S2WK81_9STRA|mmetsp:Transcript_26726/g.77782  ORF Transcript_26726/g.77782 Transcript_26726/m.77782 type:complete len:164 (+) Transcript_26726:322-813(+)
MRLSVPAVPDAELLGPAGMERGLLQGKPLDEDHLFSGNSEDLDQFLSESESEGGLPELEGLCSALVPAPGPPRAISPHVLRGTTFPTTEGVDGRGSALSSLGLDLPPLFMGEDGDQGPWCGSDDQVSLGELQSILLSFLDEDVMAEEATACLKEPMSGFVFHG